MAYRSTILNTNVRVQEHLSFHNLGNDGYVVLAFLSPDGKWNERAVRLSDLPAATAELDTGVDQYISQNSFWSRSRKKAHLKRLGLCFLDLDTYKIGHLLDKPPEQQAQIVLQVCDDRLIPPPSIIVFSGRGLQVKWLFHTPVPGKGLARWDRLQRELVERLLDLGADPKALDASRVLRQVGSVNSKSGQRVRLVHAANRPTHGGILLENGFVGYSFDFLCDELLPLTREDLSTKSARRVVRAPGAGAPQRGCKRRKASAKPGTAAEEKTSLRRSFDPRQLAADRIKDVRTLFRSRGWTQGAPEGQRNAVMFVAAVCAAQRCSPDALEAQIAALASEFAPKWTRSEIASCTVSVVGRAKQARGKANVEFDGRRFDPRYSLTNRRIIEMLSITDAEQTELQCILGQAEAKRRDAKAKELKRREAGVRPLDAVKAERAAKAAEARRLRALGKSRPAIAAQLGIGLRTVDAYCKAAH